MNKITERILSIVCMLLLLFVIIPFIPIDVAHADIEKVWLQFDDATISGNVITFDVDGTDVSATVSGTGYEFKSDGRLEITYANIWDVKITLDDNFDGMKVQLHDGRQVVTNGDKEMVIGDIDFTADDAPHVQIVRESEPQGNTSATINYSITGVIEYTSGGGFDHGITFSINDSRFRAAESKMVYTEEPAYERDEYGTKILDNNNNPIPILDPETGVQLTEKTALTIAGDNISYNYTGTSNKVDFKFTMAPGTLMSGLTINGQVITNLPKTSTELETCYSDHTLVIPVTGIDKADHYDIEITARYPNSSEEFMSNFLWDYNPQGYTAPDDKILHGTLVFVKAEYDGHVYTTPEEINALGGVYLWRDAVRKDSYADEREGCGEAQFPKGTILTVKIIPDSGYQLIDFGLNGRVFEPQEEIGTYTFDVGSGPFHLQATIEEVDDEVNITSEKISAGAINLGDEESMSAGTARLDVKDVKLTKEQISKFEKASDGYSIKNYLDISLFNTIYKGTASDTWDTEVKDLKNDAEIILQLSDDVNGEDIVIVHEKHDGTYEVIPTEYLKEYNAIVFNTKSFSNYAIAAKASVNPSNPTTGDNIVRYIVMLGISIVGLTLVGLYTKKRLD